MYPNKELKKISLSIDVIHHSQERHWSQNLHQCLSLYVLLEDMLLTLMRALIMANIPVCTLYLTNLYKRQEHMHLNIGYRHSGLIYMFA
jgi:hypothetical protein